MVNAVSFLCLVCTFATPHTTHADIPKTLSALLAHDCEAGNQDICFEGALTDFLRADSPPFTHDASFVTKAKAAQSSLQEDCTKGELGQCSKLYRLEYRIGERSFTALYLDFVKNCERGHGASCAQITLFNYDAHKDANGAFSGLYEHQTRLCDDGDHSACTTQGRLNVLLETAIPDKAIWHDQVVTACDANHARACTLLSEIYAIDSQLGYERFDPNLHANKAEADKIAFKYASRGCELGNPVACFNKGQALYYGIGVNKNWYDAQRYFTKACKGHLRIGCDDLYTYTYWVQSDPLHDLQPACDQGDFTACFFIIERNFGPLPSSPVEGEALQQLEDYHGQLQDLCKQGHSRACSLAGSVFITQFKNFAQAKRYAEAGCAAYNDESCVVLAQTYEHTPSEILDNFFRAQHYYEIACARENWDGCNGLGRLYFTAEGENHDLDRAKHFFTLACNNAHAEACYNLSTAVQTDDPKQAEQLKNKACTLAPDEQCH